MSSKLRLIFAIVGAAILAALATPELTSAFAGKLPPGTFQIAAVAVAAALHRMNAEAPADPPPAPTKDGAP
jgi:hypothetical protein